MAERVGMVGLGFMGQAMSSNLLKAGFEIQGFDIDGGRVEEFREQGGIPVSSPEAAARGVSWLLTSLPTSEVVREAVLGPEGIAEGAVEGLILADTTTARPEDSAALAAECATRGIRFLDASVSGTSAMAWEKDLLLVAGGDEAAFEAARPYFAGFTKAAYRLGPSGSGARAKLIINLVLVCNRLALAEGLVLGMKAEMNLDTLLTVLKEGAAGSKVMDQKGEKMIRADYTPQSRLTTSIKDVGLMLEQGKRLGTPMFLTSVYEQIVKAGLAQGFHDLDPACVIEVLRAMSGLPQRVEG
ncbi:MAG: NAD(P)-dependent oxidoreductase [bacterium]